jgi:predicted anti-sigma-YlaC factor YlaD
MNCNAILDHLFDYAEGTLPEGPRAAFDEHLRSCRSCEAALSGFRSFESLIRKEQATEPDPFVTTRILQRLESESDQKAYRQKQRMIHLLQPALVGISLVAALLTGFVIGRQGGQNFSGLAAGDQREQIRNEWYIADFVDEDQTLISNK